MKALHAVLFVLAVAVSINAQAANTAKLTGTIYDANGALVVGAKVTAVGGGKTYSAVSREDGSYVLTLPYDPYSSSGPGYKMARYDITVESPGFWRSETKCFVFTLGTGGKMNLDIALEVAPSHSQRPSC